MTFISYAQNHEDVILARAFSGKTNGFYIDIGACFPDEGSITKHFYDLGWLGINVEPHPEAFRLLVNQRIRDINLNIAIAENDGEVKLYYGNSIGETTALEGENSNSFIVPALSLKSLCEKYVHSEVDFLKVDVEGYEFNVLKGGDWMLFRPKVIVCEVTYPWSNQIRPEAEKINLLLSEHGYQMAYFDGINNYFVAQEADALRKLVSVQPNVIDNFVGSVEYELKLTIQVDRERNQIQLDNARADREQIRKHLDEVWADRERIFASRSWRITAPLRSIMGAVRNWRNNLINIKFHNFSNPVPNFKGIVKTFIWHMVTSTAKGFRSLVPGMYTRLANNEKLHRIYMRILRARPPVIANSTPRVKNTSRNELNSTFPQDLQGAVQQWQLGERVDE